jgi:hypothetical protein
MVRKIRTGVAFPLGWTEKETIDFALPPDRIGKVVDFLGVKK